jgi:hypothetical protein
MLFILLTVFAGTLVSFLSAISGAESRFEDLNPISFEKLKSLFSW